MIELWFDGRKKRAQAVMTNRVNQHSIDEMYGVDREILRSSFCKLVYIIPPNHTGWDLTQAVPVVSRDICVNGLSIVHDQPIRDSRVLIGLPGESMKFVEGRIQHSTPLGHGFFHIGIFTNAIVDIEVADVEKLLDRAAEWDRKFAESC